MVKRNIIIVSTNYLQFTEKVKEISISKFTVWYEKIYFNDKFKFTKCKVDTEYIVLKRLRSRNDIIRWLYLSRYSITVEKKGHPMFLAYPKIIFNCPPNMYRLLPKNIKAQCKIYEL